MLAPTERARRHRAYWECFIHERFIALSANMPICLPPLPALPEHDPSPPPEIEQGWFLIIQTFMLIDAEFVELWNGDRSRVTSEFVERKHRELRDDQWQMEVSTLSPMQQADLIITRQWLRTLVLAIGHVQHLTLFRIQFRIFDPHVSPSAVESTSSIFGANVPRIRRHTWIRHTQQTFRDHRYDCGRGNSPAASVDRGHIAKSRRHSFPEAIYFLVSANPKCSQTHSGAEV